MVYTHTVWKIVYIVGAAFKSDSLLHFTVHLTIWLVSDMIACEFTDMECRAHAILLFSLSPSTSLIFLPFLCFVLSLALSRITSYAGGCMGKQCAPCTLFVAYCLASAA